MGFLLCLQLILLGSSIELITFKAQIDDCTYAKFTYNRLDLSFSIPKDFLRSPSYQPTLSIWIPRLELSQCSLSHVSATVYMWTDQVGDRTVVNQGCSV